MEKFDAVVVGAGPAGATCARLLSESGLKVLLLEKKKLPRFKLCGGALSERTIRALPASAHRLFLTTIRRGELGLKGEKLVSKRNGALARIVERSEFDAFLARLALDAGAQLGEGESFLSFSEEGGKLVIRTSKRRVVSDFLVGADGASSAVARALGFGRRKFYRSLELFLPYEFPPDTVRIELGFVKRGYLWVFPSAFGTALGIASTGRENLYRILGSYARRHLRAEELPRARGWVIPFAEGKEDVFFGKKRVLLVGDAGNFVDPLLGEGILYAMRSALFASEAIVKNPSEPLSLYTRLAEPVVRELTYAGRIARLAYRFQSVAFKMAGQRALESYMSLLRGEKSYERLFWEGLPLFLKSLFLGIVRARV
ncbi:MAG: geranylgeranyl reductase family protein [Aquificae bacterium]|nr:geranylgeranyl reductase family protein [Aquificota bacterium]